MKRPILSFILIAIPSCIVAQEVAIYENAQVNLIDNVTVASLDPGVVDQVRFQPGQQVSKGQTIVLLDRELYSIDARRASLELAIAKLRYQNDVDIRYARKTIAVNEKTLQKSLKAVQQVRKSISETEIERLKLERDQAILSREQAELEREVAGTNVDLLAVQAEAAQLRLNRRQLASPIDGVVVEVPVQVGESVTAGQPIARVINLDRLRIKAVFAEEYAFRITRQSVAFFELRRNGQIEKIPASVFFVSPEISLIDSVFEVWADVDNSERRLLPGLKGTLRIELADRPRGGDD